MCMFDKLLAQSHLVMSNISNIKRAGIHGLPKEHNIFPNRKTQVQAIHKRTNVSMMEVYDTWVNSPYSINFKSSFLDYFP